MRPTLAAEQVQNSLSEYLATTYALADEGTRRALESFLTDPDDGIFRGPYLRIRTPYRSASSEDWQHHLQWWPKDFRPHRHQESAWRRLSTLDGPAEPTLVTTGTGSGKTESFLVPILDHCRRARERGHTGIKAVLLYPMNALATDQANRINDWLDRDPRLSAVTAGLYIGDTPSREFTQRAPKILADRAAIRRQRPDILLTNYKMLDLLVQRPEDQTLWQDGNVAYVVLDEFHTYDGAQGTDVAMLLRRFGAMTGVAEPGRPLGSICPIATSATLGAGDGATEESLAAMLDVAGQVFGVSFPPDSVVREDRQNVAEFAGDVDFSLPFPSPQEVIGAGDPTLDETAVDGLAAAFTGRSGLSPAELGRQLRRHRLTAAVLEILDGRPRTTAEILDVLPRHAYHWGLAVQQNPGVAAQALARFIALLSHARDPDDPKRPLLSIEVHHWVRSVSRVLRGITPARAEFMWDDERVRGDGRLLREVAAPTMVLAQSERPAEATPADDSAPPPAQVFLPAVFCRECGRSGWAALSPETDPVGLEMNARTIRHASVGRDKRRVRNMMAATVAEAREAAFGKPGQRGGPSVMVLDGAMGRLRPLSPEQDFEPARDETGASAAKALRDAAFVVTDLANDRSAERDQCPACRAFNAIRYLGTGLAALAAASITQLFTGGELDPDLNENKTLLFNDSVQDAAHRAGYVASRAYTFSLRALLARRIAAADNRVALNDLAADLIEDVVDSHAVRAAVIPPDLHVMRGVDILLTGRSQGSRATWELIARRLSFATIMEFGLRSRQGRTLELTRTIAAEVPIVDEQAVGVLVSDLLRSTPGEIALPDGSVPDSNRQLAFIRGLLERLRIRGAIRHEWLDPWLDQAGVRRWLIWGGRKEGMPAFPRGVSAPAFLLGGPKRDSLDFDVLTARSGWYQDWTVRCLGVHRDVAIDFLSRLLPALAATGVLSARTAKDGATRIYGLQPGHIHVRALHDGHVAQAGVRCTVCSWQQTVPPDRVDDWHGSPCPRYRCTGTLYAADAAPERAVRERDYVTDFYRRMYRNAGVFTVNTAEHTGTLTRAQREAVEKAFRDGVRVHYANPQVLSCTPTLELGIDIGDLSAVVLASLPKGPANYIQRAGRAGRQTGNAYLLTMVDRGSRDRYYLADPRQMIDGDIRPPGCFLSAVEILRRQYVAYLLDNAAAGKLSTPDEDGAAVLPLPRMATALFGSSGWLSDFTEAAMAHGRRHVDAFLHLFPPYEASTGVGVRPEAAEALRDYAVSGLSEALDKARRVWEERRNELQGRVKAIDDAVALLVDGDPEDNRRKRELRAERGAVAARAGHIGRTTAQGALVELGLLPNYSLTDSTTELEATLTWREDHAGGKTFHSRVLRYDRSARFALVDFAPGAHYYVQGYKHKITGLDLGSAKRPSWTWWRVCPDCGYARTDNAEQDTSGCPRCHKSAIGDIGCLHRVHVPRRVFARDDRDDARVRDERDERERRVYTTVPAVDIAHADIEEAWRHQQATFGWDFTRRAMIRHINVGAARRDGSAEEAFAGHRVRLNPFWVCDACGFADPDGGPRSRPSEDSEPGRVENYHRPWCRVRSQPPVRGVGHEAATHVLLAHELCTEALRILVPAVTAYTEERLASLKAALLAGIAQSYGGDPDHLEITSSSMPDPEGGAEVRRHFLVVYDTLPGGTGYLHRLADPGGLYEVLTRARRIIERCPCVDEGRRACHRCLLRHVADSEYELVSRDQATDIIGELLGVDGEGWQVERAQSTHEIALGHQVESELEARFLKGLLEWAGREEIDASARTAQTPDGARSIELRLSAADGTVTRWQVETQVGLGYTRPDLVFRRLDAAELRVAVYLDGYQYHASSEHNRLAVDAAKRTRLRAEGWQVFQLTWDDVKAWTERDRPPSPDPVWLPYQNAAQRTALDIHRRLNQADSRDLPRYVWANPIVTLLAYLTSPDPHVWLRRAQSALAGFAAVPATSRALAEGPAVAERIAEALSGAKLAKGRGAVQVMETADLNGCRLVIALDLTSGQQAAAWTALTVLDDSPVTVRDDPAHHRRWQAWLYWTNLLQFLNEGAGDGVQLAASALSEFEAAELAVGGGIGWLSSKVRGQRDDAEPGRAGTTADAEVGGAEAVGLRDSGWDEVLEYLEEDPGLPELAKALAKSGVPAPVAGFELGDAKWPAELAWPDRRVAVVLSHRTYPDGTADDDARDRDHAYIAAGWQVRTAKRWDPDELRTLLAHQATSTIGTNEDPGKDEGPGKGEERHR
ncbi:DEAD/DEAH box helicase [Embleya sp. NPDC008237]|uniref:DEAD/DEAH box helicase n=1 Tax=Embleya sp. NPDC008237 TaxID=3363978 RepID=UPI0036E70AE5